MKYQCSECDFHWEGTVDTFDKVREHEKHHLTKNKGKTSEDKNNVIKM